MGVRLKQPAASITLAEVNAFKQTCFKYSTLSFGIWREKKKKKKHKAQSVFWCRADSQLVSYSWCFTFHSVGFSIFTRPHIVLLESVAERPTLKFFGGEIAVNSHVCISIKALLIVFLQSLEQVTSLAK